MVSAGYSHQAVPHHPQRVSISASLQSAQTVLLLCPIFITYFLFGSGQASGYLLPHPRCLAAGRASLVLGMTFMMVKLVLVLPVPTLKNSSRRMHNTQERATILNFGKPEAKTPRQLVKEEICLFTFVLEVLNGRMRNSVSNRKTHTCMSVYKHRGNSHKS